MTTKRDLEHLATQFRLELSATEQRLWEETVAMERRLDARISALELTFHRELREMQTRLLGAFLAVASVLIALSVFQR